MFVVSRDVLYKTLNQLNRAINKTDLDEFGFVHLCTTDSNDSLIVQAKNSLWSLQMSVPDATVVTAVDVMVPAKYLMPALKKMPDKLPVTVSFDPDTLLLRLESRSVRGDKERILDMTIECQPGSTWTGMYTPVDGAIQIELPYSVLLTEYPKVIDCAATVDNRPVLTGIYIDLKNFDAQTTELTMSCADGYRLAIKTSFIPQTSHELEFLFYADMWREWLRLSEDRLKAIKKNKGEGVGFFKVDVPVHRQNDKTVEYGSFRTEDDSIVMSWKYLKGRFPDFSHIAPTNLVFTLKVDSAELRDAVDTALIYGAEDAHFVRLDTSRTMRQVVVTGKKPGGQAKITDTVPAELTLDDSEPDDVYVIFDGRFVLDTLDRMPGEVVLMSKTEPNESPWIFTPVSDSTYKIVIMPVTQDHK